MLMHVESILVWLKTFARLHPFLALRLSLLCRANETFNESVFGADPQFVKRRDSIAMKH